MRLDDDVHVGLDDDEFEVGNAILKLDVGAECVDDVDVDTVESMGGTNARDVRNAEAYACNGMDAGDA